MAGNMMEQPGEDSPWSQMLNTPLGQKLVQRGMQGIQNGEVDPEKISPLLKAAGVSNKKSPLLSAKKAMPFTPSEAQAAMNPDPTGAAPSVNVPEPGSNGAIFNKMAAPQATPAVSTPTAKGSGLSDEQQNIAQTLENIKNANTKSSHADLYTDPEQLQDLYSRTAALPSFKEQQDNLNRQKDILSMTAKAPTDNFSGPLAGLLQSEFGRNASITASKSGVTPEQQRTNLLNMGEKNQDDQRDLSKSIFDAINKQRAGYYNEGMTSSTSLQDMMKAMSQANAMDPNKFAKNPPGGNPLTMRLNVFKEFQKNTAEDQKALEQSDNAVNTLNSGTFVGDAAVKALLARASSEVGRLSTYEQEMFTGSPALASRLNRAITKAESGRLDDSDRADMLLLANTYKKFRQDQLNKKAKYFSSQVGPALGQDPSEMNKMLIPDGGFGLPAANVNPKIKNKQNDAARVAAGGAPETMVSVTMSNGLKGKIPQSQVKAFIAAGAGKVNEGQ